MLRAFHCNWSAPFRVRHPDAPYQVAPFELLTTVLSALFWQKNGGSIAMLCDRTAASFYQERDLSDLWDGGINTRSSVSRLPSIRIFFGLPASCFPCVPSARRA